MSEDKLSMEERIKRASEVRRETKRLASKDSKYHELMQNLSESIFDYSTSHESPIRLPVLSNEEVNQNGI